MPEELPNEIIDIQLRRSREIITSARRTVGIDLTGSEKKPSGWACLDSGVSITRRLKTNEELIALTCAEFPDVISIDAPLSLPMGRITVFDDDPGRQIYGITRSCERLLAKRGIRSYPPLIKSMQQLTLRGMLLAQKFRNMGFQVIEGYPGGAQDILGIPRKKGGIPELIKGLQALGVSGTIDQPKLTHDELDAITAAIVGCFYLAGQYEAVGAENEGLIIVPRL